MSFPVDPCCPPRTAIVARCMLGEHDFVTNAPPLSQGFEGNVESSLCAHCGARNPRLTDELHDLFIAEGGDLRLLSLVDLPPPRVTSVETSDEVLGDGKAKLELTDDAADREHYVIERAELLARAYLNAAANVGVEQARAHKGNPIVATFRDLIDNGVLK